MCLENPGRRMTAKKDIVVYKVLSIYRKELITPYYDCKVEIGNTYTSELDKPFGNVVDKGLHSFKTIIDCEDFMDLTCLAYDFIIVKCIIPKGSEYYRGWFSIGLMQLESLVSDTLKYVKCV